MGALRQHENRNVKCPQCGGRVVKAGKSRHKKSQKYRCNDCPNTFTLNVNYDITYKSVHDQ